MPRVWPLEITVSAESLASRKITVCAESLAPRNLVFTLFTHNAQSFLGQHSKLGWGGGGLTDMVVGPGRSGSQSNRFYWIQMDPLH